MTEPYQSTSSDHDIHQRILAGDADALTAWFRRNKDSLYSFIYYRVGGDQELASDALQATFTAALERLAEFDPERGDMITWLRFLSRNIVRDAMTQHRRGRQLHAVWERLDESLRDAYEQIDRELLPDQVVQRQETRELVDMALANLPSHYRVLLEAKYIDNQPIEAIATLRETTVDSVKSMLRRARAAFRECFLAMAKVEMSDV